MKATFTAEQFVFINEKQCIHRHHNCTSFQYKHKFNTFNSTHLTKAIYFN